MTEGKVIAISEQQDLVKALPYAIDHVKDSTSLSDLVEKGIHLLNNDKGFFMMVEGGKIDWACHQNDTSACIQEVIAFGEAVQSAIGFYKEHQDETLILVTADHETGGLSLGYAETNYNLYLDKLQNQKVSYESFYNRYVMQYKKEQTPFQEAMKDVAENFGLTEADTKPENELSYGERKKLEEAYEASMKYGIRKQNEMTEEEYVLYGCNDPFTITILHILANKAGVNWSTYAHTAATVPVYAYGKGQELFGGYYDNTDIFQKITDLTGIQ